MSKHKKKDAKCKLVVDTNPIQIIEEEEVKLTRGDSGEHQVNTIDERTNFKKKIITSKNCSNKVSPLFSLSLIEHQHARGR